MSVAKRAWRGLVVVPALACSMLVGCGDDDDGDDGVDSGVDAGNVDSGVPSVDGGTMDATVGVDAGDAGLDAGPQLAPALAKLAPLSPDQNDRFSSVVFGADGKIYAAGYVRTVVGNVTDQSMAVARYTTDGNLDPAFGTQGVATVNLTTATAEASDTSETARGIALQSDGKIVITGIVPKGKIMLLATAPVEQHDIAVARLTATGALDTTYSAGDDDAIDGARVVALGPTLQLPPAAGSTNTNPTTIDDSADGVAVDAEGRAVVFASGKAEGDRTDRDRYVLRFTAAGVLDETFAGDGKYSWDVSGMGVHHDNAKLGLVLAGNKIVSPGYTSIAGKNTIGLVRLNENGTEDTTFSEDGRVVENPLPAGFAEAYGAAVQSNGSYVTAGYGHEGTTPVKLVSFRWNAAGVRDTSYGVNGAVLVDVQPDADQARSIVALPDDRLLIVGNSNTAMGVSDGLVVLLGKDGQLDRSFNGTGTKAYDFGRTGEQFLSVALSRDGRFAAAVGYSSGGMMGPDDATLWIQRLKD